jgi:hypothetical protein
MLKQVNDFKVEDIGAEYRDKDTRPIKGQELVPDLYANLFIASKKNSGKTTLICNIIKNCCDKNTTVIIFSGTLQLDPLWKWLRDWAPENLKDLEEYSSIIDDDGKTNLLKALYKRLEDEAAIDDEEDDDDEQEKPRQVLRGGHDPALIYVDTIRGERLRKKRKKKSKYRTPKYLLVLDDISEELRNPAVAALLKKNRHFKCRVIVSSQYPWDLMPASRNQLQAMIIFGKQPDEKIVKIYEQLKVPIPFELFYKMYKAATPADEPYSFFYFEPTTPRFKKNFSHEFEIPPLA